MHRTNERCCTECDAADERDEQREPLDAEVRIVVDGFHGRLTSIHGEASL